VPTQIASLAPTILRYPGGSQADTFHWQNYTNCNAKGTSALFWQNSGAPNYTQYSSFDNFMTVVENGNYNAQITLNYGSNVACTGGGDPAEAAAWVAYAKQKGYNQYIHYWTVGNESFGSWEFDLHSSPWNASTYAAAVGTASGNGYYAQIKAADPTAQVGVVVTGGGNWDTTVLANSTYDFVEVHWYPQLAGSESDSALLASPQNLTALIASVRRDLATAGKPNTPIMLGEFNSVNTNPGKQSVSIVNGLFTGMTLGEVLNDNVFIATWFQTAHQEEQCGNMSSSLYGFQTFGTYDAVADSNFYAGCGAGSGTVVAPTNTVFPSGTVLALTTQKFAQAGNSVLGATVGSSLTNVRAYAASQGNGYALMLFNLSETSSATPTISVINAASTSFTATATTYGKAQYDDSQNNVWTGAVANTTAMGGTTPSVTLPPWSVTVLQLK
jgi:hypothetical protein